MVSLTIWIDADACPGPAKEVVFKAAERTGVPVVLVANSYQRIPRSPLFKLMIVDRGFDAADQYILDNLCKNDIVITSDIPLAHEAVQKEAHVISPRGDIFTPENIADKLATRNLLAELRGGDLIQGGPSAYSGKEKKKFAEAFDRTLTRAK